MPKKKRILVITLLAFFGFLLITGGTLEYTSRPKFCTTCHYMQPFYDSWVNSTHREVTCVDCHYEPGWKSVIQTKTVGLVHLVLYITQVYKKSKPVAEVSDGSCLRPGCHETRLLAGREKFRRVFFDHQPHLGELRRSKKLRCTSCHSQIVQGDHMRVTPATCYLCHFKTGPGDPKIHNCDFCHVAPTRENTTDSLRYDHANVLSLQIGCERCHSEMIVGDGAVFKETCYNCHYEQSFLVRYPETEFMHRTHITNHKIECEQCHSAIQHKLPDKQQLHLLDCNSCHQNAHQAEVTLFKGSGGFKAREIPNPMFMRSITCKGCHVLHQTARGGASSTLAASEKSCENCHGQGFNRLLEQWKKVAAQKLARLGQEFQQINAAIAVKKSHQNYSEAEKLLQEARHNIDLVNYGKSIHNIQFADELLRAAHLNQTKIAELLSLALSLNPYPETSQLVPTECNTCHFGIETAKHPVRGMQFSHQSHIVDRQQTCQNCHSHAQKHGALIMKRAQCAPCHHQKEISKPCVACHSLQAGIYGGTFPGAEIAIRPDTMFQAEVNCEACHNPELNKTMVAKAQSCFECHEAANYQPIYDVWREQTLRQIDSLKTWFSLNAKRNFTAEQKRQLAQVQKILELVQNDGSEGVHNPKFIHGLLRHARTQLPAAKP